jgi:succinoglycan biosynthesis protein ExoV
MIPFHWESQAGNFGDDLNLWLWDFLLPGFRDARPDVLLVGVGTVLNSDILPAGVPKLVLGSGFGYGVAPDMTDPDEWDVRAVRGPLTAEALGLDPGLAVMDPAIMVSQMPEFRGLAKTGRAVFVPHWTSATDGMWADVCETLGIDYLDPRGDAKTVIGKIARAPRVLAESMHAAIIADAFRVPWTAVTTSREVNSFKWRDWAASVEVEYAPCRVPVSTRFEARMKGERFWGVALERSRRPSLAAATVASGSATGTFAESRRVPVRKLAKQVLAAPAALALWRASRVEPQLSRDEVLDARKQRFEMVLERVRKDYL